MGFLPLSPRRPLTEGVKDSGPTGTWTPAGRVGRQVNGHVIQGRYMMIECGTLDIADGEWKMTERWDSGLAGLGGGGLGGQINLASRTNSSSDVPVTPMQD